MQNYTQYSHLSYKVCKTFAASQTKCPIIFLPPVYESSIFESQLDNATKSKKLSFFYLTSIGCSHKKFIHCNTVAFFHSQTLMI